MELWRFLGDWHPKLVQFPLVLLLVGLLLDGAGVLRHSARARWAGLVVTTLGTLGLLFAFICGIYAEIWAGRSGVPQHPVELHETMANIASWGFVILFAWRILLAESPGAVSTEVPARRRKWLKFYVVAGLLWYSLLGLTAYLGGQLVFEYGAGVHGVRDAVQTFSDLNTLATRQTDKNLWYSEWMHHIFGWMTLGLAASLLAQAIWPKSGRRLAWIVPAFFMAGGIFLFFWADLDLYKLTDLRQFRDREVQLHKVIAIVMGTVGGIGMWRWGRTSGQASAAGDQSETEGGKKSNSKLVAVVALIGGALLFTHVHTVAPYANVAAGVYIAHVVLGLIALSIGATRMAQDHWPKRVRPLAVVFATLMLAEAVLLISYNEGLPWYIGYGRYDRWGPHGGTVAPYGAFRAELVVDTSTGGVEVYVLDAMEDVPREVAVPVKLPAQLLITRGGLAEIAIPLTPVGGKRVVHQASSEASAPGMEFDTSAQFHGQADFLRTTPAMSARLKLANRMGYFDPWVTPVIAAVPPNELARYECPMHEGMRATEAGVCPLCGMPLVEIRAPRPAGELHDAKFVLRVETGAVGAQAGAETVNARLVLRPQGDGGKVVALARVHEQLMHVLIVSENLGYFDHVHPLDPAESDGGAYVLNYAFPRPGRYVMFADVTPSGDRQQVFRTVLQVSAGGVQVIAREDPFNGPALPPDVAAGKMAVVIAAPPTPQTSTQWTTDAPAGKVLVQMTSQPRTIYAGLHAELIFRLADSAGVPLTDLSPYLGAMGHCVAISEDTQEFTHSHPAQLLTPAAGDRGGPEVVFHALFAKAGRYRLWAQFKRGDELVIASFTVEVKNPPVPAGLLRFLLNE